MNYVLTFGYIGHETKMGGSSTAIKNENEPIISLEKVIKIFNIDKDLNVKVDFGLVYQGNKSNKKEINSLWNELVSKKQPWKPIREKLNKLLELGELLLPIAFEIFNEKIHIEIVDGEHTMSVASEDLTKISELKESLEKELDKRTTPYGNVGHPKINLTKK
ncbi:MAG: hypothetical protein NTU63_04180 [Candidatus Pacearchaeota archaeon]|nr:hypothetical protein [Candidatus Pacearchaeota archaeon]